MMLLIQKFDRNIDFWINEYDKIGGLTMEYILKMEGISKSFPGVKALDKVNLFVRPGSVHSLMGENGAGKSTLMKCLFGIYFEDEGDIFLEGKKVKFSSSRQALTSGVAMVQQELNQAVKRNVMDNVWLGRYPKIGPMVDHKKMYQDTLEIFKTLEITVDPKETMSNLSVSQRQMVEIAKAVSYDAKVIAFDEPTSSLTDKEIEHLFSIIDKLKKKGCGIIYISHKMDEILRISDDVTIMRDGKWISTTPAKDLTINSIIKQMVGRSLDNRFPDKTNKPEGKILEVKNFSALYKNHIEEVSFDLKKGEILGLAGLVGAGRTEVLEMIFGITSKKSGDLILNGKKIDNKNSRQAIKNGFALLTEERRATGIFGVLNILENATVSNLKSYQNKAYLNHNPMKEDTKWVIDSMRVKTPGQHTKIGSLSGGNQQKVIIGRWLLTKPEVLLLDEPTRGIDVGAKYEIYQLMINLASTGKSIIMASSEMPELLGICDRILVMSNGRVAGIVDAKTTTQEELMSLSAKYM